VDGRAGGCNLLIRDGATLVRSVDDVIEVLARLQDPRPAPVQPAPVQPAPVQMRADMQPDALDVQILSKLGPTPMPEDQLIRDLRLPASQISPALVTLELMGAVQRHPGGMVSRVVI
jgi:DNA processing protein